MRNLHKEFENKNIEYDKLVSYGFVKKDTNYIYEKHLQDHSFKVVVEISAEKQVSKVIDLETNEEFILVDVKHSVGDFVGTVKEEYGNLLKDILDKCTTPNVFKSKQAKEVIQYEKEKYADDLEYLWKKFPNNAIWINKKNNKWYGALLVVAENKLGVASDKVVDILDLRYPKENIRKIIDNKKVFEGYHMNKEHWITIRLDGSMDINEIFQFIDLSYDLSLKK